MLLKVRTVKKTCKDSWFRISLVPQNHEEKLILIYFTLFFKSYSAFEKVALGVLDECRKQDDDDAQTLVIKELPNFGHLTSLDIAVSAEDQDFISHPTCQSLLSRLWMGALSINTPSWQVCTHFSFLRNPIEVLMIITNTH